MKITCTQEEKEQLILAMSFGACPFAMTEGHKCVNGNCAVCIEKGIEWEIKEGEKK